jgi:hypothetical protein
MQPTNADTPVSIDEQARLDGLNATVAALTRAGIGFDQLLTVMKPDTEHVEQETGQKLILSADGAVGPHFTFAPRRCEKTYARVRKPNQVRFLAGMIKGVWIVVNLHKPGVYRYDNLHVAEALRMLAGAIERTNVPLADQDTELQF